jgi:hypothetical protein
MVEGELDYLIEQSDPKRCDTGEFERGEIRLNVPVGLVTTGSVANQALAQEAYHGRTYHQGHALAKPEGLVA